MSTIAQRLAEDEDIGFNVNKTYGTPSKILDNLMQVESSGNEHAINKQTKAMGPYQFMPETVAEMHKRGVKFNAFDKREARAAADYYINYLAQQNGGDYRKALAAYGGFKSADPTAYVNKVVGSDIHPIKTSNQSVASRLLSDENEPESKVTVSALEEEPMVSPEGIPLITSQEAYQPRSLVKTITQDIPTGIVSAPISAALGVAEPIVGGVQKIAALLGGNQAVNQGVQSFEQMQQGIKQAPGVASYATTRPAELAGELGPLTTGIANAGYNAASKLGLASDLAKGIAGGAGAGAALGALQPVEAGKDVGMETFKNSAGGALMGGLFPVLVKGAQVANKALGLNFGARVPEAVTQGELVAQAKNLYDKAKESGIQFRPTKFADEMFRAGHELRQEGFTPKAYPGIDSVLNEAIRTDLPKDFTELQALRKMIQGQQKSPDPETRRLASILKDRFDDYILNAPAQHVSGSAEGAKVWQDARQSYSRLKKAEIFDDMLEQAQLEGKTLYTHSGSENSLAKQLRQLAKNDRKMRTFTPEEQEQIKKAAEGGSFQNLLRFYGKFAPTSPVTAIFAKMSSLPLSAGALVSKSMATKLRERDVQNLADFVRMGGETPIQTPTTKISDIYKLYQTER